MSSLWLLSSMILIGKPRKLRFFDAKKQWFSLLLNSRIGMLRTNFSNIITSWTHWYKFQTQNLFYFHYFANLKTYFRSTLTFITLVYVTPTCIRLQEVGRVQSRNIALNKLAQLYTKQRFLWTGYPKRNGLPH